MEDRRSRRRRALEEARRDNERRALVGLPPLTLNELRTFVREYLGRPDPDDMEAVQRQFPRHPRPIVMATFHGRDLVSYRTMTAMEALMLRVRDVTGRATSPRPVATSREPRTSRRVVRTAPSRGDPSPSEDDDSPPVDPADLRRIGREAGFSHTSEPLIEELERLTRETL